MAEQTDMSLAEQVNGLWAWVDFKARDSFEHAVRKIAALEQRLAAAEHECYCVHCGQLATGTAPAVCCNEYDGKVMRKPDKSWYRIKKERDTAISQLAECQKSLEAARERINALEKAVDDAHLSCIMNNLQDAFDSLDNVRRSGRGPEK